MITEDGEISKSIFEIIYLAIEEEYELFEFSAFIRDGYLETKLWITSGGICTAIVKNNINYAILCDLIEDLKARGMLRGDDWRSFTMTYVYGGQVKVKFEY
ncbi:hypothetical protein [Duganella sp. Root336D2]|uniref:hypothetical protein n=1 Tax=Duganella sp. Root336D2 TaxID=1736518 RepID=UPI000701DCAB|nr:hypothetical protein [Duganella sp. Root336D2]KQV54809.1 hypothetical protein ASD07_29065 [Duganella sp. Root336D2]